MHQEARERLVIVGNGMAGARTLAELVRLGAASRYTITLFGEEPRRAYNRVLLSGYLAGPQSDRDLSLQAGGWLDRHHIRTRLGERVTAIDRKARMLWSSSGGTLFYDRLVLATGSRPRVPKLPGLQEGKGRLKRGAFVFRSLEDAESIDRRCASARRAIVLGGGPLGLEMARALQLRGLEVELVHRGERLLGRYLDPNAAGILASSLEALGIRVHLGVEPAAVTGGQGVEGLQLADGRVLPGELLVLCCGTVPNTEPAKGSALAVEAGILTDDRMQCPSDPRVSAVGECAQHRGRTYSQVGPVYEQAGVLAEVLADEETPRRYSGSRVVLRPKCPGLELAVLGRLEPEQPGDEVVRYVEARRGIYQKLVIRDHRLHSAILLGDGRPIPYLTRLYERGLPVPLNRSALLYAARAAPPAVALERLPDSATICHCNGVSLGDVKECWAGGGVGLTAVMRHTRAGSGCGSCKHLLREVLDRLGRTGAMKA